jgi:hypothetical protein
MELDELWYLVNSDTDQLGYKICSYWSHSYAFISAGRKKVFLCYFMTFPFDHRMVPILYMLVYNTCSGICLFLQTVQIELNLDKLCSNKTLLHDALKNKNIVTISL